MQLPRAQFDELQYDYHVKEQEVEKAARERAKQAAQESAIAAAKERAAAAERQAEAGPAAAKRRGGWGATLLGPSAQVAAVLRDVVRRVEMNDASGR